MSTKLLSVLVLAFFILFPLFVVAQPTIAVQMQPRTSSFANFRTIYNVKGDFSMIGNTNVTLATYYPTTNNNNQNMRYVNQDDPAYNLLNSSSSTLMFSTDGNPLVNPECSNVVYAGLYWAGRNYNGGSSNSTQNVQISHTIQNPDPVYVNETLNQPNGPILSSSSVMNVTFTGGNPNYTTNYLFGNVIFRWEPTGSGGNATADGPISYSLTGQNGTWISIPTNTTTTFTPPGNPAPGQTPITIGRTLNNPITFTYGPLTVTVSALVKAYNPRNNTNYTGANPYPYATIHVEGWIYTTYTETTTYEKNAVKLRHESESAYVSITASDGGYTGNIYYPLGTTTGSIFVAYADITGYVQEHGVGEYWVADIALREGASDGTGFSGGWGMVVVYENDLMRWRDITVFDGYGYIASGTPNYGDLYVSGFHAVQEGPVGVKLGLMACEGDVGLTGDYFAIQQVGTSDFTNLSREGNNINNFFNSSIYVPVESIEPPRNPLLQNNTGIDISMFDVPNEGKQHIRNNQTNTTFRYGTGGDIYTIFSIVVGIDAYIPEPETQNIVYYLEDKDGFEIVPDTIWDPSGTIVMDVIYESFPLTKIVYTLEIRNRGTEAIDDMLIQIPVPYTTEFITASRVDDPKYGFSSSEPTMDYLAGATGILNWNIGHLPLPASDDQEHCFTTLTFELVVTDNCDLLIATGGCEVGVVIDGLVSGIGHETGVHFSDMRFIYGWKDPVPGACQQRVPLYTPPFIQITVGETCPGDPTARIITICKDPEETTVPYDAVVNLFQRATRFYDSIDIGTGQPTSSSIEYTPTNPFPATEGTEFYAIPYSVTGLSECYWIFKFDFLNLPYFDAIDNDQICGGEELDLSTLVSNLVPVESKLYFYSDPAATNVIDSIVSPLTTTTYYARSNVALGYGCASAIVPIVVTVKPTITETDIDADGLLLCSEWPITFEASTELITNPEFRWYSSQTAEEPIHTGDTYNLNPIEVLGLPLDTTVYVAVFDPDGVYCENPPGSRKAVTATILNIPILKVEVPRNYLCGGYSNFELYPTLDEGFAYDVLVPCRWEWYDFNTEKWLTQDDAIPNVTGTFSPFWFDEVTRLGMNSIYYPSPYEISNSDSIMIRFVIDAYCGEVSDVVTLYINGGIPDATMEIIEQPEPHTDICNDHYYTVLITETGEGGLANLMVTFDDWKASEMSVVGAEFYYPVPEDLGDIDEGEWIPMNDPIPFVDGRYHQATFPQIEVLVEDVPTTVPFTLEEGNSVLVRFIVHPECEFYAGSDYRILLNANDMCVSMQMPTISVTTDRYTLDWEHELAEYSIFSEFNKYVIQNEPITETDSRIVVWSVEYVLENGEPEIDNENIYFNIPIGMTLLSIKSTGDFGDMNIVDPEELAELETGYEDDPLNREYAIPIYEGMADLLPTDTVKFEITFQVDDSISCGTHFFYLSLINSDQYFCLDIFEEGENDGMCDIYETLAEMTLELDVELYWFTPIYGNNLDYSAVINYNATEGYYELSGVHQATATTPLHSDTWVRTYMVADMDNNGILSEDELENHTMVEFDYPFFDREPGQLLFFYVGREIPWMPGYYTLASPIICGQSLFMMLRGETMCDDFVVPVVTICGDQLVCQGDTVEYLCPPGMDAYTLTAVSETAGVPAPERIPLVGQTAVNATDHIIRLVCHNAGEFYVSARYAIPGTNNEQLNQTVIHVEVVEHPQITYVDPEKQDTTICKGQIAELTHFFKILNDEDCDISYYIKGETTPLELNSEGLLFVEPWETTDYTITAVSRETGCEVLIPIDFTVIVNTMPKIGTTIHTFADCGEDNGTINVSIIGGSGNYSYSFTNEDDYLPLPISGDITGLAPDNYILYIKDNVEYACPPSVSQPISISTKNGILVNAEANSHSSACGVADGEVIIAVNGGLPPYEYSLDEESYHAIPNNGIISGVAAGKHGITVRDSNTECPSYTSVEVLVVADDEHNLSMAINIDENADCTEDAKVTLTVTNGEPPYQYQVDGKGWTTMTGNEVTFAVEAGWHTFSIIDMDDCAISTDENIPNTSGLVFEVAAVTNGTCAELYQGSIKLDITSGDAPFTYTIDGDTWHELPADNTIPNLTMGIYTVTVADKDGCLYTIDGIELFIEPEIVVAMDNVFYTYMNQQIAGNVKYNDFDLWKQNITLVEGITYPLKGGMFTVTYATGSFVYTPPSDYVGIDSVIYVIENPCGMRDSAWLIIHILNKNPEILPPIALQDEYITRMNEPITGFEVRLNDYDPIEKTWTTLTIPEVLVPPQYGVLTQNTEGEFTYTPNHGFVGVDMFIYKVCNEDGCTWAEVHITVNHNKVMLDYCDASDDYYQVPKYETLTIDGPGILANDDWPAGGIPSINRIVSNVTNGTLTFEQDGSFVYTPNYGYSGSDGFTYELCADNAVNCDIAFVYIFIPDNACPDSAVMVLRDTAVCMGEYVDLDDLLDKVESENIADYFFYSDKAYSELIANTTVNVAATYYIRAENQYGCSSYDSVKVELLPYAEAVTISANDVNLCNETPGSIHATATGVENPTFYLYENNTSTTPIDQSYDGIFSVTADGPVTGKNSITYYISVKGDNYCENEVGDRKAVTVTYYPESTVEISALSDFLCGSSYFTFTATVTTEETLSGISYLWERETSPGSGTWAPAPNMSPGNSATTMIDASQTFTYNPQLDIANNYESVALRIAVTTPVCGAIYATELFLMDTGDPNAIFTIVSQPEGVQTACEESYYILKIEEDGEGGLTNIRVTLDDWIKTIIGVSKIEYQYMDPDEDDQWFEVDIDEDNYTFTGLLLVPYVDTVKLENNAEIWVRFTVFTDCGFYAGQDYRFLLNGTDICGSVSMPQKSVISEKFHLDWGDDEMAEFTMTSTMNPTTMKNSGLAQLDRDVVWLVEYAWDEESPDPNFEMDSIYFNMPYGMTLKEIRGVSGNVAESFYNGVTAEDTGYEDEEEAEFRVPIFDGILSLTSTDIIQFEIVFEVDDGVVCGDYEFYVEIDHKGYLECAESEESPCVFYETLASSDIQVLTIDLYFFEPYLEVTNNEYFGVMNDGWWGGTYRVYATTDLIFGDYIDIEFWADVNGNGEIDDDDTYITTIEEYPVRSDIPAGNLIPITIGGDLEYPMGSGDYIKIDAIEAIENYQLLARPAGPFVCAGSPIPLVTIFGPQKVCQGETYNYATAEGMLNYTFTTAIVGGSTTLPIRNLPWSTADNEARYTFTEPGEYSISANYLIQGGLMAGLRLNQTFTYVTVVPKPDLVIAKEDTTVCTGQPVELSHFVEDIANLGTDETIFYYDRIEDNGDYTPVGSGSPFTVAVFETTTYRISAATELGCVGSNTVEFTVIVDQPAKVGSIWEVQQPTCTEETGIIGLDITGGSGNYSYSINNTDDWETADLTLDQILYIEELPAGYYTIYVKDNESECTPSISEGIWLRPANSGFTVKAEVENAETCTSNDGTITLYVNGGKIPYQYSLDGGDTYENLPTNGQLPEIFAAGSYIIYVKDDSGCEMTTPELKVYAKTGIEVILTQLTAANCAAMGSAKIEVTGDNDPFQYRLNGYNWVDMAGNVDSVMVPAGERYIYVRDANGCEAMGKVTIDNIDPDGLSINDIKITPASCPNSRGTLSFSTTGNPPQYITFDDNRDWADEVVDNYHTASMAYGVYYITLYNEEGCITAEERIEVGREESMVQAVDNYYTTYINVSVGGNLILDDWDYNNGTLTMVTPLTVPPKNGTITSANNAGYFFYKPNVDFVGLDTAYYTVVNSCGLTDVAALIINVLPREDYEDPRPPIALNDYYNTDMNTPVGGNVTDNDVDPNDPPQDLEVNTTPLVGPFSGTVTLNADGTFTYTPNDGFYGMDMFMYQVCNDEPLCDVAVVFINVRNPEVPDLTIEALPDEYTTPMNVQLVVDDSHGILPNDRYPDDLAEDLTITLISGPIHGSLELDDADGSFTYTPNNNYIGSDGFTYEICGTRDEIEACSQTYVNIFIYDSPCPDMPVFEMDSAQICYGETVDLKSLMKAGHDNVDSVQFYSDNEYSDPIFNTVVNTSGYYYIRVFNRYECYADGKTKVTVNPLPTVHTIVEGKDTVVCSNESETFLFEDMVTVENGTLEYSYDKDDWYNDLTEYTITPNGSIKIYFRGNNTYTKCVTPLANIDSVTITTHPVPTVKTNVTASDTTVCLDVATTFDLLALVTYTSGSVLQYSDSKTGGWVDVTTPLSVGPNDVKKVYVRGIFTATGCATEVKDLDSLTMRVYPVPTIAITVTNKDTAVCSNENIEFLFNDLVTGAGGTLQYSTSKTGGSWTEVASTSGLTLAPEDVEKMYFRTYNTESGCVSVIDSAIMRVNPRPVVELNGDDDDFMECSNIPVVFDLTDKVTADFGVVQYSESMDGPWETPINNYTVQVNQYVTIYFRAFVEDTECYTDDDEVITIMLRVNPVVEINITHKDTIACSNEPVSFDLYEMATAVGGDLLYNETYEETYPGWAYVDNPHYWTVAVNETKKMYYRAKHIDEYDAECWSTIDSITMHVYPLPGIETTVTGKDTAVCSNSAITFDLTTMVLLSPSDAVIQYSEDGEDWITGDTYTVESGTSETIYLRALNTETGCFTGLGDLDEVTMTVHTLPEAPEVENPLYVRPNEWADLEDAVITETGMTYVYYETADKSGGTISSTVQYILPKDDYYVAAINEYGCEGPVSQIILRNPCFALVLNAEDVVLCSETDYHFNLNDYADYDNESGNDGWLVFSVNKEFTPMIDTPEDYVVAMNTTQKIYISAYDEVEDCYSEIDSITLTVYLQPLAPIIVVNPLYADPGQPADLSEAIEIDPNLTYTYYEDEDLTLPLPGSIIIFPADAIYGDLYYYYVVATNEHCQSVVSEIIVTRRCPASVDDNEGNTYKVITLAKLCWTENLKSTFYANGDEIIFAKEYTCSICPDGLAEIYGLLYTWYSAVGEPEIADFVQGICPDGYHIPYQAEWNRLEVFSAQQLKSMFYWLDPPGPGTDDFGWDARPAGWYNGTLQRFVDLYGFAGWWAVEDDGGGSTAAYFKLTYYCDQLEGEMRNKIDGLSVRCVMDY